MQKFLAPFPLVRLLVPLACGIALAYVLNLSSALLITVGCAALAGIYFGSVYLKRSSKLYFLNGTSIFLFFFCCGMLMVNYRNASQLEREAQIEIKVPVIIRVTGDPEPKENNVRCTGNIIALLKDSSWQTVDAGVMLYLKRNPQAEQVKYGDELQIISGVNLPSRVMNPGEFDYAAWLHRKGIGFVCFAKDEWRAAGHHKESWIKARALELRTYFRERLAASGLTGQELAVSEALLLGQSSEIDPQLLASYSASGTLHVLSVSGMHVALVFVVLLKILAPLEKRRRWQWISFAIQFFVIWFYAFLTGMSPSVLRAVTMLSVIIAGRMMKRKAHLLNTLAASAIILLMGDPMLLQDAGFLLSYCAVAGIVVIQPMIETWWTPRSAIVKPLWGLMSVTLAAQVFTFPLGLYFFQQFPTWFLLTNLIVIPLSTICLYAGLFLLCISWWTWAAALFGVIFSFLISLLNSSVSLTEFMPGAVLTTSAWRGAEIVLLYGLIIFTLVVLQKKIRFGLMGSLACLLLLMLSLVGRRSDELDLREITVFHVNRGMVVGVAGNGEAVLLSDSVTVAQPEQFDFHVEPHYRQSGIESPQIIDRAACDSAACAIGQYYRGCIFTPEARLWMGDQHTLPPESVLCDALVIHAKNFWLLRELASVETHEIIVTGEVKPKWVEKWKEEGKRRKIPVHVTGENGARVFKF